MRKFLAVSIAFTAFLGFAMAEEFGAVLKKVDGNKITVQKNKKGEKGEEVVLTVAEKVKVAKGKVNVETKKVEVGEAIEGGLKNENLAKGGAFVRLTTNDDNHVTQILVVERKKKKE